MGIFMGASIYGTLFMTASAWGPLCKSFLHDYSNTPKSLKRNGHGSVLVQVAVTTGVRRRCAASAVVVFTQFVDGVYKMKSILRRVEEFSQASFAAKTNHRNEYVRPMVERHHPLVSLSSDVLHAALQCNSDVQFVDRAAPCQDADDASACGAERASTFQILYGMRVRSSLHAFALRAYRVA